MTSREYAKMIADLVLNTTRQLLIGDEVRDGMIKIIDQAKLEGIRLGLQAAAQATFKKFARDWEGGDVLAIRDCINALSPTDIAKEA